MTEEFPPTVDELTRSLFDHLGVDLWRALTAWEDEMYARAADRGFEDITVVDSEVLVFLPPAGLSISDLARRRGVSKQAMSQAVNSLAKRGYLDMIRDAGDKRVLMVRYTRRGLGFVATLREVKTEMQTEAEAAFGSHRLALLSQDLRRVTALYDRGTEA